MLGDDIAAALDELRAQAESMMTSTVTIERPAGATFDPDTNEQTQVWEPVHQSIPARLYAPKTQPQMVDAGEQTVNSQIYQGTLPWSTTGVHSSDRITITDSDDPDQVGKTFTILSVLASGSMIARRFTAIDDQE
jgi:hypothetical protein